MKKIILLLLLIIPISVNAKNIRYVRDSQIITISVEEDQIQATLGNQNITIKNINEYKNIFLGDDRDKYPVYINSNFGEYELSNKKSGTSYIVSFLYSKMIISDSQTNLANTCESLFGYQFIQPVDKHGIRLHTHCLS